MLDEVFSHPRPWSVRLEEFNPKALRLSSLGSGSSYSKGKGKQTLEEEDEEEDEGAPHCVSTHEAYPPTTDQVAETRKVEEVRALPFHYLCPCYIFDATRVRAAVRVATAH